MRPVFFMHIPKTAGTSVRLAIEEHFSESEIVPDLAAANGNYPPYEVLADAVRDRTDQIKLLRGHYPYCARNILDDPVTIVVFRDPMKRTISTIRHVLRHGPHPVDFVLSKLDRGILPVEDNLMTRLMGWQIVGPMESPWEFLTTPIRNPEKLLANALEAIPSIDFLGLTESVDALARSLSTIGLNVSFGDHNVSPPGDWFPTPRQLDVIRDGNKLDAQLYNEACRDFTRRYSEPVCENGQVAV